MIGEWKTRCGWKANVTFSGFVGTEKKEEVLVPIWGGDLILPDGKKVPTVWDEKYNNRNTDFDLMEARRGQEEF